MVLFVATAVAILWISGCVLGLALCTMLARAEGREPASRGRRASRRRRRYGTRDRVLPTA